MITYEGEHRVGRMQPGALLEKARSCMATFGFAAEASDRLFALDVRRDDSPILNQAYDELTENYGKYPRKLSGFDSADGREWKCWYWQVSEQGVDSALDHVAELGGRDPLLRERVFLKLIWKFRFRDPDTRELLSGQSPLPRLQDYPGGRSDSSTLVLNLGSPSAASLWFVFPFAEPNQDLLTYAGRFQQMLPIKLSSKRWRKWTLTRAKTWKSSRISPEIFEA